jgi:hypothetical protein
MPAQTYLLILESLEDLSERAAVQHRASKALNPLR